LLLGIYSGTKVKLIKERCYYCVRLPIEVITKVRFEDAVRAEAAIHERMKEYKTRGEWFKLDSAGYKILADYINTLQENESGDDLLLVPTDATIDTILTCGEGCFVSARVTPMDIPPLTCAKHGRVFHH
jgi:hypothetical protein